MTGLAVLLERDGFEGRRFWCTLVAGFAASYGFRIDFGSLVHLPEMIRMAEPFQAAPRFHTGANNRELRMGLERRQSRPRAWLDPVATSAFAVVHLRQLEVCAAMLDMTSHARDGRRVQRDTKIAACLEHVRGIAQTRRDRWIVAALAAGVLDVVRPAVALRAVGRGHRMRP